MEINNYNITNFRSRKIPRYIYHFTNAQAYKSMYKDGFIKASTKDFFIKGKAVFFIELENFCKNWGFNKSSKKLFVRSENKFFEQLLADKKDMEDLHPDIKQNIEGNTPATKSKLYKNRKEAIEYIYKDDIPIENAEQIGQILDINVLDYDRNNTIKSILQKCLKGLPEEIAISYLSL